VHDFTEISFESFAARDFEAARIESELVEYGGVQVGHVVALFRGVETEFVG
jgi:hypothetical protein